MVDAVDKVRKQEHRVLMEQGNEILSGTKYLWLWNEENVPEYRRADFDRLRSLLSPGLLQIHRTGLPAVTGRHPSRRKLEKGYVYCIN